MGPRTKLFAYCVILLAAAYVVSCDNGNPIEPSCTVTLDPASLAFTSDGGSGTVTVSTSTPQCGWTAASTVTWIAIVSGTSGTGAGSVKYTVAANASGAARNGSVVVGGQVHNVTQNAPGACAYDVTPSSATFDSNGGQATLVVSTTAACSWTATTTDAWITISGGASGQGNGTVTYTIAKNSGAATRTATIHVAGHDVSITQSAPGCSFSVSPQNAAFGSDAAQGLISVTAPAGCAWTASTNDSWLTIVQGTSGQGDGTVIYNVTKQASADARAGSIRVAGVDVRVVQSGDVSLCQYSVAPVTFNPCMPASTMTTTVTTSTSCPWTAGASVSWLTIAVGQAGTGPGTISFSASDNYDAPRTGVIMVRWPTPTQGQNVQVGQAGCSYTLANVTSSTFGAAGASGQFFDVYQMSSPNECGGPLQDGCVWTAVPDVPWITVSPTGQTKGDGRVLFSVGVNSTGAARTGTIRVRDKVLTITQSGS